MGAGASVGDIVSGELNLTVVAAKDLVAKDGGMFSKASSDPLVTWHQGGPGGSSIDVGLYTEMGYFQIDDQGFHTNEYAWNKVANLLYLESPAGSGQSSGFSACIKGGKDVASYSQNVLMFFNSAKRRHDSQTSKRRLTPGSV